MSTVKTKKGTELPLINLKGKQYLQVAYRIQWFTEETPSFHIESEFPVMTADETVAKVTVSILDDQGRVVRKATGTKRENTKGFGDHLEKAETGALGRALIQLGFGTQFALADLDEGDRLADAPVVSLPKRPETPTAPVFKPKAVVNSAVVQEDLEF